MRTPSENATRLTAYSRLHIYTEVGQSHLEELGVCPHQSLHHCQATMGPPPQFLLPCSGRKGFHFYSLSGMQEMCCTLSCSLIHWGLEIKPSEVRSFSREPWGVCLRTQAPSPLGYKAGDRAMCGILGF